MILAALTGACVLPALADSIATSASSAGSVSSRTLSDSIGQSSDSSSRDRKVAQGEYRVLAVEQAAGRADTTRLRLQPVRAEGGEEFFLFVPDRAIEAKPLRVGDHVLARQRAYGFEFARAENQEAFLLALRDDWHRELESHPVTL
ncbi:hypothetical protein CDN99_05095 [Roseateles aquatilis]|uniref:DUF4384 domain-containing protein n=2 Tax=Roseateles aquatilis TaxID=431061 RepID=A0A246JN30_9BURK|nr:hypothetical protein CDN99_05095 [Roseateles aquatilis]